MLHTNPKAIGLSFQRIRYLKGFVPYMGVVALTFEFFYSHFLIRFNISSENNDFGFNSIQKINFSKNSHLNALGSKFDLDVK